MSPLLVLSTIVLYFFVLFFVSYITGKKADNQGFFVGNRKSSWYVVAFAMIGSSISGVTFVSVPGMVVTSNFAYLQMILGFFVGQLIIAFILIPMFYRMNVVSIYEYLEERFGLYSHRTGAWFFFISKMLGAAVRLYLVCVVFQLLIFEPWGLPFWMNVTSSILLVWLYTYKGGVKTLIWTDSLKTFCLILSVVLCIYFIKDDLNLTVSGMFTSIIDNDMSRIFFFDDVNSRSYFFKQFLAGIFTMIAMTGLDQDMMQRNLSCKNFKDAQKNIITSAAMLILVVTLFLMLGVLLYLYAAAHGIAIPEKTDELFPLIANESGLPAIVGILFVLGLVAAAYSAAGSALTSLTTSYTVDVLQATKKKTELQVTHLRKNVHVGMSIVMGFTVYLFYLFNNTSVIDAVYVLASYTYGPILGLFVFGLACKKSVYDRFIPLVAVLSPVLCYVLQTHSEEWFNGYKFSYELLIFNAAFTVLGCILLIKPGKKIK